jgi:glycosyltransferase involved in cell wall biosynthesis
VGRKIKILHVEVGGTYGGSLKALEAYLANSSREMFSHDILFYYPTHGTDNLQSVVHRVWSLYPHAPQIAREERTIPSFLSDNWGFNRALGLYREARLWKNLLSSIPTVFKLRGIMRSNKYDIVHVNNTFNYQAPTLVAAALEKLPIVSHVRNPVTEGVFNKRMLRLVDCLVTVAKCYEVQFSRWKEAVSIKTCYDSVLQPLSEPARSKKLRESMLSEDGILIGSVGRLDPQKGYENLVRAARIVIDRLSNRKKKEIIFAIAGDGNQRSYLEKLINELNLSGFFKLCGFRNDVPDFVGALDLFVSSSLWEGLPIAVLEAMMLEKPVIATAVGGTPEIVIHGVTGCLVSSSSPESLAVEIEKAVKQILNGYDDSSQKSLRAARELALKIADARTNAVCLEQCFNEVYEVPSETSRYVVEGRE